MKTALFTLFASLVVALPAAAQAPGSGHDTHHVAAASAPAASAADLTAGEVRKVDKAAGKVTIKHEELKNLEMPPMTMVFSVRDPLWLDQLKAGDRIRFKAARSEGKYTVTELVFVR